jgi:hypothetical protein
MGCRQCIHMSIMIVELKEQTRKQRMLGKANFLMQNNKVRRSTCKESRNVWMVSSYSTPKKWYVVKWNEELDCFTCGCKSFEFSEGLCLHIAACTLFEGGA